MKRGYPVKSANLTMYAGNDAIIADRCHKLQREMLEWLHGARPKAAEFDGTFRSIFDLYENDARSPFHRLKASTRQPYSVYLQMMRVEIGHCHIDQCDGRDVRDWFNAWMKPAKAGGKPLLAKANMAIAVLKSALAYGIECRKPGCAEFRAAVPKRFTPVPPRRFIVTADQVAKARLKAHAIKEPGAALAYALQFEGSMRQWDVIGKWEPMSDPRLSDITFGGKKWFGLTWEKNVDEDLVLRFKPTKTEDTSGEEVVLDLKHCPMVMEELQHLDERTGPLVVSSNGRPFGISRFERVWRKCADAAEIGKHVWNRDLRKSGSTEARRAGAAIDDVKKVLGHTTDSETAAKVYDVASLEAHRRVAASRIAFRNKKPGA